MLPENSSSQAGPGQPTGTVAPTGCILQTVGKGREEVEKGGDDGATHRTFIHSGRRVVRR